VDPSPSRYCVTMGRKVLAGTITGDHTRGVDSSDDGYAFRWEQMAECKMEQVPQVSVEAAENEACNEKTWHEGADAGI